MLGKEPTNGIEATPAEAGPPAPVSVYIDDGRRVTVQTSDLQRIGEQLRGKKQPSFFDKFSLPILISVLTVIFTTLVGQFFQYVSWRNSDALQTATAQADRARETFQKASLAISKRYYATALFLDAVTDLANRKDVGSELYQLDVALNERRFNAFYRQLKSWNDDYDQSLTAIDYNLDGPVLHKHERVSIADFEKKDSADRTGKKLDPNGTIDCKQMLISELVRLKSNNIKLDVDSLKVQFAALNYCFVHSLSAFSDVKNSAVVDNTKGISDSDKKGAWDLNEGVRQMSDEFRCYAQHYIIFLEGRKAATIKWASSERPIDLDQVRNECNPSYRAS